MAPLVMPQISLQTNKDEWQAIENKIAKTSSLHMNYEGTIMYTQIDSDNYAGLFLMKIINKALFVDECNRFKLYINLDLTQFYVCNWDASNDSDMRTLLIKDYVEKVL